MRKYLIGLASSLLTGILCLGGLALAGAPGIIQSYVGVCNPDYPDRCIAVNSDGSINVNGGGGGGGGTSSNFNSAFPTAGTAAGASDGTNMKPLLVDASGFLKVILQTGANVIGAVTQSGTWNIATLTSITNPVAATQSGAWTVGQSGAPWTVTGTGSAGSPAAGVLTIQGIPSASPVAGNVTFLGSAAINLGAGNASTGTQRVLLATDQAALPAWGTGAIAAAVPAGAQYVGLSDGTNLRGWLGAANSLNSTGAGLGTAQAVGQCDDTSPTALTENSFGNVRISCADHAQYVEILPSAAASAGITPVVTSAVANNLVLKAGAGNLYGFQVTSGASAGYVMVFNATSAPADGAVTPIKCMALAANSTIGVDYRSGPPPVFSTGITVVFSTTGCFTKTASATAFISGEAK